MDKETIKVSKAKGDKTIISFGPLLRADSQAKYRVYVWSVEDLGDGKISAPKGRVVKNAEIPKSGRATLNLPKGSRCVVMARGLEIAGVVTTKEHDLKAPFYLKIDSAPSTLAEQKLARSRASNRPKMNPLAVTMKGLLRQH